MKKSKDGKLVSPLGIVQPFNPNDAVEIGEIEGDLGAVGLFTGEGHGQKVSNCQTNQDNKKK